MHQLILRDSATHSENFIVGRKQKLQLSELKSVMYLNDLYFLNCCKKCTKLYICAPLRRGEAKVKCGLLNQQGTAKPGDK